MSYVSGFSETVVNQSAAALRLKAAVATTKLSLDAQKTAGQSLIKMLESSSIQAARQELEPHKGRMIDIYA